MSLVELLRGGTRPLYIDNLRLQFDSGFVWFQIGNHVHYVLRFFLRIGRDIDTDKFIQNIEQLIDSQ